MWKVSIWLLSIHNLSVFCLHQCQSASLFLCIYFCSRSIIMMLIWLFFVYISAKGIHQVAVISWLHLQHHSGNTQPQTKSWTRFQIHIKFKSFLLYINIIHFTWLFLLCWIILISNLMSFKYTQVTRCI